MLAGDRVFGTDADRHEDISHNGSSGFGDNADSATADLSPCPINAQIAAPLVAEFVQQSAGLFRKTVIDTCAVKPMLVAAAKDRGWVGWQKLNLRYGPILT
jgi:hypothetical protein